MLPSGRCGSLVGEAMPARDGMRCVAARRCTVERCMGRDALREGACVKERGAAAVAARRCTAAHGWHALELWVDRETEIVRAFVRQCLQRPVMPQNRQESCRGIVPRNRQNIGKFSLV